VTAQDQPARSDASSPAAAATMHAHGGLARWRAASRIEADVAIGGTLWAAKGHDRVLADAHVTADTRRQRLVFDGFGPHRRRTVLTPAHIAIRDRDQLLTARNDPRSGFPSDPTQPWDDLQVAYFASYAMWNYLTLPFLLSWNGFGCTDLPAWPGTDPRWRRIQVDYPPGIDTHTRTQYLNVDTDGLLVRHDYDADVLGGAPAVNTASDHHDHQGIVLPSRRRVTARDDRGATTEAPVLVSIDFAAITVT
jgi:hypothetical protein